MEEVDKGFLMIRMGVEPAYPDSPGLKAVKWLCVCVYDRGLKTCQSHPHSCQSSGR